MYHVGPNGWTQVWAGDTTEMFYKYYPSPQIVAKSIVEHEAAMKKE